MKAPGENPITFKESIDLNQPMTPQQAVEQLATFHNAPSESILKAFMNLRGFEDGTVEFKESVNNGNPCIAMTGKTPDGKYSWNHLIDKYTGQPQMRCG